VNAQDNPVRFEHLTIKDGLSQSMIYSIFQDSFGYLWIGTQDGLNRYDGNQFTVYKNNPFDSTTLTHNWVWSVQEDNHGDIWLGTFQGLCKYIRTENRFVQYYNKMEDPTSVSGNRPNFILKDKKGRLWISSWSKGLNLYDEKTNSFRRFLNDPDNDASLSDNYIRTLFCDHEGVIWVGTWNGGLNKMIEDENGIRFLRYDAIKAYGLEGGNRITSIASDKENNLWIASYESGLIKYDRLKKRFERFPNFSNDDVNKIISDSKGNIWIGTNKGLVFFDSQTKTFNTYVHNPQNQSSISSNVIYALAEDRDGLVWISGNGLDKYDPHKNVFRTYRNEADNSKSLTQNSVWSFCEDDNNKIWIGTESGPVNIFDPVSKICSVVNIKDDRGNTASYVHGMVLHDGIMWLASVNVGLIRYDLKSGKAKFYNGAHPSALGKVAHCDEVLLDNDNTLWISTNENGLFHLDPKTDQVTQYNHDPNNPHSLGANFLRTLYKDRKGNIWIGFWGGGMSMLDKTKNQFINYAYDRKNINGLSDQVVNNIEQENDSIYWISTQTGLNRFNINTGRFKHFFEKDNLISNVVYDMLRDEKGNYWISSNGGLSSLNSKTFQFRNYTEDDGLQSNEFNANASLKSTAGEFYFGGVNGFTVFDPAHIKENEKSMHVVLEQYKVHDQSFIPEKTVHLDHHQNYLSFHFSALEFSAPKKIKYAYMLENFDKEWNQIGNSHEAFYTNLDPGKYVFRVKASNAEGFWSDEETTMTVMINPPFWRTWWFIFLVVVVLLSMMYGIHRYRLLQSLRLERLRNKIASDLHDEVGSSLTRISIYSDLLQNGMSEAENTGYLKRIGEVSREVVGTMSDIVWSIDSRNDSFGALILRMKDFANEILQAKNIEVDFNSTQIDADQILDPELKQNIYLIFKETVNNIVKHATASQVKVILTNDRTQFSLTIQDNGKGFQSNGNHRGNGLRNIERRAKAMNAVFSIKSFQGTVISVTRPGIF
jgi:ligand-binding sensor domain-containing protein